MGNYNLKSSILRCQNCSAIRKMTIIPGIPNTFVNCECKCDTSKILIQNFLSELKKGAHYKFICIICKKEDKSSYYCHECNHLYCSSCIKEHKKHKYISVSKVDYYCVFHPKELFCSYCNDCSSNFCKRCIKEDKHKNHKISHFNELIKKKNSRNYLKEKIKLAENKLDFNTQFINAFVKKLKNEEEKNIIINAEKKNTSQNKDILELINFFIFCFENSKYKNYNIIYNFIENINLNVNKFKFSEKNVSIDYAYPKVLDYFNKDFIIIRNENIDNEKERKNMARNRSIWDIDENTIEVRQTMIGTMAFDSLGLNIKDNLDKNEMNYNNEKVNIKSNRQQLMNSINIMNFRDDNIRNNNNNKNEDNEDNGNEDKNDNTYYRPRSHVFYIPTKDIQKKIKEKKRDSLISQVKNDDDN